MRAIKYHSNFKTSFYSSALNHDNWNGYDYFSFLIGFFQNRLSDRQVCLFQHSSIPFPNIFGRHFSDLLSSIQFALIKQPPD